MNGFDFVMYQAKDMAKTRAFYESLFNLTPAQFVARTPDHGDFVARQVRADAQPASH